MRSITTLILAAALAVPAMASDCLRTRLIDGFRDIDDHGLTLVERNKTKWRAEFNSTCYRIQYAMGFIADARGTCFEPGDAVVYVRNGTKERCIVSSLEKIEEEKPAE